MTLRSRLLIVLALTTLIASCAGDTTGTTGASQTTALSTGSTTGETTPDGDQVEITLWAGRDYFIPEDNFEGFHEAYPNIHVNADVVSLDDVFQNLSRMRDAGQPLPDIVHTDGQLKSIMVEAGFAGSIQDVITQWETEDPDLYAMAYPAVWEGGTYDGELVAMADTGTMDLLVYRFDWFEDAGFGVPTSWSELLDIFRAIKAELPDVVPFAVPAALNEGQDALFMQMSAMGIEFEGGIPILDSEAGIFFIDFYQTLGREGLVSPDAIAWTQEDARGAFASGRAAATSDGWGQFANLADAGMEYGVQFRGAAFPLSREGGSEDGTPVGFNKTWYILSESEHPYEASLVLRYLMWPEIVLAQAANGQVARHEAVLEEGSTFYDALPGFVDFKDAFINASELAVDTNYLEVTPIIERLLQDLLTNTEEAPESVAARWQAELDAVKTP